MEQEIKYAQEWIPIEKIFNNGIIKLKNKNYIKIIKIKPINFSLKSNLEKEAILNSYKNFLKTCDFDIQILIQSKKEDISKTISQIKSIEETNEKIREISENYINFIKQKNEEKNSSSKNFYIIIRKKVDILKVTDEQITNEEFRAYEYLNECFFKIKETLTRCGNLVNEINSKKDAIEIFNSFIV